MTRHVTALDHSFPGLDQERAAAERAGCTFSACRYRSMVTAHGNRPYAEAAIARLSHSRVAEDITNHLSGAPLRKPVPGSAAPEIWQSQQDRDTWMLHLAGILTRNQAGPGRLPGADYQGQTTRGRLPGADYQVLIPSR